MCGTDNRPTFEEEEEEEEEEKAAEATWCQKRYESEMKERTHSAGALYAFHDCGYSFPPVEMVGPESLTQVLVRCSDK